MTLALAVASIGLVAYVVLRRLPYPYELEWLEGSVLQHIREIRAGRPPYSEPSLRFAPSFYTPLFHYISALVMQFTRDGFLAPRLVSLGSSLGTALIVWAFVRRERADRVAALCGATLFIAGYWWTGRWFEVARVDNLFVFLALAGAFCLRFGRGVPGAALAGLVLALALCAKQTAALMALPLFAWCYVHRRRELLPLFGVFALLCLVVFAYLEWMTEGWFGYCMFSLPAGHPLMWKRIPKFWLQDVLANLPFALALLAAALVRVRPRGRSPGRDFYAALLLGGAIAAFLPRVKAGGYDNNLLPLFASVAVGFGVALGKLRDPATAPGLRLAALALAAAQLAYLAPLQSPLRFVPTERDHAAGDRLVAFLAAVPGAVLVPTANYLATRVGKAPWAHHMNILDVIWSERRPELQKRLALEFATALNEGKFDVVILATAEPVWLVPLPNLYQYRGALLEPGEFEPTSGATAFRPAHLFVRRGLALPREPGRRSPLGSAVP